MSKDRAIDQAYGLAKERYGQLGVDTDSVLAALAKIPISLHCWQGDDVGGYIHRLAIPGVKCLGTRVST